MKKERKKEFARDFIAIGGIPFFLLVIIRTLLIGKTYYPMQFVIAGAIFLVLMYFFKANLYAGISLIILVFTSLYYGSLGFVIVGGLFYLILVAFLFYLKEGRKEIVKGILFGAISSVASYYIVSWLIL